MMSPTWGVYSGYELYEHVAVRPGTEEYLDTEKYQLRPRDYDAAAAGGPQPRPVPGPPQRAAPRSTRRCSSCGTCVSTTSTTTRSWRSPSGTPRPGTPCSSSSPSTRTRAQAGTTSLDLPALGLDWHDRFVVQRRDRGGAGDVRVGAVQLRPARPARRAGARVRGSALIRECEWTFPPWPAPMPAGSRSPGSRTPCPGCPPATTRSGSSGPSSTRSSSAASPTPAATAAATCGGLIDKLDYLQLARRRLPVAAAVLPVAAARRRLRHRRLRRRAAGVRHRRGLPPAAGRGARARHAGDRRLRHEPHLRPAPVVPGLPVRPERPVRRLLRLGRRRHRLPGRADHLHRHRDLQLDASTRSASSTSGTGSSATSRTSTSTTRPCRRRSSTRCSSGWTSASTASGWTRCPTCSSGRAPTARTCRRRTSSSSGSGPRWTRRYPDRVLLCEANQWPQDVVALLRRPGQGRRVPDGLPLPGHAAHLHGGPAGAALPDLGDHGGHAGDPGQLPVGHLPAQPRRADAGDGHRRRARLHVGGVRPRPADEGQPRHPPPAGPAAGQRPRPDPAVHRAAAVAARLAGPLLRRRDRDGRQHLARRPRRRPHPDAVDAGPQRRLLHLRPGPALPAGEHGLRSTASRSRTWSRRPATPPRYCTGPGG